MPGLNISARRDIFLLVALLFVQLLLMSGSARRAEGANHLESWWMVLSTPVVHTAQWVGGGIHSVVTGTGDLFRARSRNEKLEREVMGLREEIELHREALRENERLRQLLQMRENLAPRSVAASVVTAHLTPGTRSIVVDRGRDHGVRPDLPVVAWGGVVGRVVASGGTHSKVQLLDDPNSGIAGMVQRSRAQGMVLGQGEGLLKLVYVPGLADVDLDDRVVSSGLDGVFPRGFGIGRVRSVTATQEGSQIIRLEPEIDYRSLEEVLILIEPTGGPLLKPVGAEDGS